MIFLLFFILLVGFNTFVNLPCVTVLVSIKMDNFYTEPTSEAHNLLKKKELTEAVSHNGLEVPANTSKMELRS